MIAVASGDRQTRRISQARRWDTLTCASVCGAALDAGDDPQRARSERHPPHSSATSGRRRHAVAGFRETRRPAARSRPAARQPGRGSTSAFRAALATRAHAATLGLLGGAIGLPPFAANSAHEGSENSFALVAVSSELETVARCFTGGVPATLAPSRRAIVRNRQRAWRDASPGPRAARPRHRNDSAKQLGGRLGQRGTVTASCRQISTSRRSSMPAAINARPHTLTTTVIFAPSVTRSHRACVAPFDPLAARPT